MDLVVSAFQKALAAASRSSSSSTSPATPNRVNLKPYAIGLSAHAGKVVAMHTYIELALMAVQWLFMTSGGLFTFIIIISLVADDKRKECNVSNFDAKAYESFRQSRRAVRPIPESYVVFLLFSYFSAATNLYSTEPLRHPGRPGL